jgi:glycosyltransferase involved in cell wall biosynthesis
MTDPQLGAQKQAPRLTVGVIALNEERHIGDCLKSVAFADELIVIDGASTDRTAEIARAHGAIVHAYPDWKGFGVQRNRLLQHATGDYVLFIDADERVTPELRADVDAVVRSGAAGVWTVRWRVVAFGRELRFFQGQSPIRRLFRRDQIVEFTGVVHESAVLRDPAMPVRELRGPLLHYSRETIHGSLRKLTQYAMLGAAKRQAAGKRGGVCLGGAVATALFVRLYFFKGAFLHGGAGFLFCFFIALEGFFRYAAVSYDRDALGGDVER